MHRELGARSVSGSDAFSFFVWVEFFCELFSAFARHIRNGDGCHRHRRTVSRRTNFTGFVDHDVFTADVRLQTERSAVVCHTGEPLRSATRVSPVPDFDIWEIGEYRFARRRILVSPPHVTSAFGLRLLSKPGVTKRTPGFIFCRRQRTSDSAAGRVLKTDLGW